MVVLAGPLVSSANLLPFSYETFASFYYMYFQPHLYVLSSDKASRIPSTRTATHAATTKEKLVFFFLPAFREDLPLIGYCSLHSLVRFAQVE